MSSDTKSLPTEILLGMLSSLTNGATINEPQEEPSDTPQEQQPTQPLSEDPKQIFQSFIINLKQQEDELNKDLSAAQGALQESRTKISLLEAKLRDLYRLQHVTLSTIAELEIKKDYTKHVIDELGGYQSFPHSDALSLLQQPILNNLNTSDPQADSEMDDTATSSTLPDLVSPETATVSKTSSPGTLLQTGPVSPQRQPLNAEGYKDRLPMLSPNVDDLDTIIDFIDHLFKAPPQVVHGNSPKAKPCSFCGHVGHRRADCVKLAECVNRRLLDVNRSGVIVDFEKIQIHPDLTLSGTLEVFLLSLLRRRANSSRSPAQKDEPTIQMSDTKNLVDSFLETVPILPTPIHNNTTEKTESAAPTNKPVAEQKISDPCVPKVTETVTTNDIETPVNVPAEIPTVSAAPNIEITIANPVYTPIIRPEEVVTRPHVLFDQTPINRIMVGEAFQSNEKALPYVVDSRPMADKFPPIVVSNEPIIQRPVTRPPSPIVFDHGRQDNYPNKRSRFEDRRSYRPRSESRDRRSRSVSPSRRFREPSYANDRYPLDRNVRIEGGSLRVEIKGICFLLMLTGEFRRRPKKIQLKRPWRFSKASYLYHPQFGEGNLMIGYIHDKF
jgi:hypothetical protein